MIAGEANVHAETGVLAAVGKDGTQINGVDVESQQVVEGATHGMVLPFMQVTVSFSNVRYFVPVPEVRSESPSHYNVHEGLVRGLIVNHATSTSEIHSK